MCKYGLKKARCNGCAFGLQGGKDGLPIYEPWTVTTDDPCLHSMIDRHKCPGKQHHPDHCAARGQVCKETESCTDDIARKMHEAWKRNCAFRPALQGPPIAVKAMPTVAEKQKCEALEGLPCADGGYSSETTAPDSGTESDCVSDSCSTVDTGLLVDYATRLSDGHEDRED